MHKIRVIRSSNVGRQVTKGRLKVCIPASFVLESGESVRRGCGRSGLYKTNVGWHCFYCGNYLYSSAPSLKALWFHFRVGRDYWRTMFSRDMIYINGVPVSGLADGLPKSLFSDLLEPNPPSWFTYFIFYDRDQFSKYLETRENG